ncbi:MAG: TIGR01458 family HAD-type hydrolase [Bacillota bacterium]
MDQLKNIKGFLIDLDGVLYIDDEPIPGAVEAIAYLKDQGFILRFITNTTTQSIDSIYNKMTSMGFQVLKSEIVTTPTVARDYLRKENISSCYLLTNDEIKPVYQEFAITEHNPQAIVIGDVGDIWDYALMQKLFLMVMEGAQIVALHKGKYWRTKDGLKLDIGAFITGLEYVSGKEAVLIGKPSGTFFRLALFSMGLEPGEAAIIGDDIDNDIGGGKGIGLKGIIVRTGKYLAEKVEAAKIKPDLTIDSIGAIRDLRGN